MEPMIKVSNVSKQYRLGQVGTGSLGHDLNRWWHGIRGKQDPYLQIGEANDRTIKAKGEYVWALKDINFKVNQGELLGIIGRNGAGKSTLLKILSRTTGPTTGQIFMKGRVSSLLEVGTGFHPELTGRENVYLNGAILGMTKREINSKLDEIIDFSGVERYIDTPVKRYSSGMFIRLGFAVAAHLDPHILIVDEVLAVGDLEFQQKCLGKMKSVSQAEGKTILFVSHNLHAIGSICNTILWLQNGQISYHGGITEGITKYLDDLGPEKKGNEQHLTIDDSIFSLTEFKIDQDNLKSKTLDPGKPVELHYTYEVKTDTLGLRVGFDIYKRGESTLLFRSFSDDNRTDTEITAKGAYACKGLIPANLFNKTSYRIYLAIGIHNDRWISNNEIFVDINFFANEGTEMTYAEERPGEISPKIEWNTEYKRTGVIMSLP